jgi:hypothetical protein
MGAREDNMRILIGVVAAVLAAGSAQAATSPFAGSWKMDLARSQLTGDTVTYTATAAGFESSGGAVTYKFAIDGKDYPTLGDRTTAWSKAADGGWDMTTKASGKVLSKAHRTLSADGKKLMTTYTEYRPDGTTATEKDVYERVSGTTGLAGKWKDIKVDAVADAITIAIPSPGSFRLEDPIYKQVITGKTDGSPVTVTGPTIPPGASATFKANGANEWDYAYILKGKAITHGVMKVSADGKTLSDTSWAPGKEAEKSVSVYAKP